MSSVGPLHLLIWTGKMFKFNCTRHWSRYSCWSKDSVTCKVYITEQILTVLSPRYSDLSIKNSFRMLVPLTWWRGTLKRTLLWWLKWSLPGTPHCSPPAKVNMLWRWIQLKPHNRGRNITCCERNLRAATSAMVQPPTNITITTLKQKLDEDFRISGPWHLGTPLAPGPGLCRHLLGVFKAGTGKQV